MDFNITSSFYHSTNAPFTCYLFRKQHFFSFYIPPDNEMSLVAELTLKPWRGVSYITNITVADREIMTLWWRHNERIGISNHQHLHCLLKCSFTHRSKKTSQLCITGLCEGNSLWPVNSPHNGPVTRKMFPFDDVIMTMQRTRALGLGGTVVMELT